MLPPPCFTIRTEHSGWFAIWKKKEKEKKYHEVQKVQFERNMLQASLYKILCQNCLHYSQVNKPYKKICHTTTCSLLQMGVFYTNKWFIFLGQAGSWQTTKWQNQMFWEDLVAAMWMLVTILFPEDQTGKYSKLNAISQSATFSQWKLESVVLLVQTTLALPTTKWESGKSSGARTKGTHSSF